MEGIFKPSIVQIECNRNNQCIYDIFMPRNDLYDELYLIILHILLVKNNFIFLVR